MHYTAFNRPCWYSGGRLVPSHPEDRVRIAHPTNRIGAHDKAVRTLQGLLPFSSGNKNTLPDLSGCSVFAFMADVNNMLLIHNEVDVAVFSQPF